MCIGSAEAEVYQIEKRDGRVTNRVCMICGEHCIAIGDLRWTLGNDRVHCLNCGADYQLQNTIGCDDYQEGSEFTRFMEFSDFRCPVKHEVHFEWC